MMMTWGKAILVVFDWWYTQPGEFPALASFELIAYKYLHTL